MIALIALASFLAPPPLVRAANSETVTSAVARSLEEASRSPRDSVAGKLAETAVRQSREIEALLDTSTRQSARRKFPKKELGSRNSASSHSLIGIFPSGKGRSPADWESKLQSAREFWNSILVHDPGSPWTNRVPDGLSTLDSLEGRIRFHRGENLRAIELFSRAFERLWKVSRLSVVPLRVIEDFSEACRRKEAKELPDCRNWLKIFLARSSEAAPERAAILSRHPGLSRDQDGPGSQERRLVGSYKSRDADDAAFSSILELLQQGEYRAVNSALLAFLEEYPQSSLRFRARWWLAKLREISGERDSASRWRASILRESPFSYYGLVAALAESRTPGEGLIAQIPPARPRDPALLPLELERWAIAESLASKGDPANAAFELTDLEPRMALSAEFLVYGIDLSTRVGAHTTALRWATELLKRDVPWGRTSYSTRWIFPLPESIVPLLRRVAEKEGIDPLLLLSLAKQESAFDADALSSAGAAGLAQLMPATALEVLPGVERSLLRDPERSLTGGARYLKRMLNRFDGNVALALAAYNAGPGAVDRWVGEGIAAGSQEAFIEQIPFKETQNYVGSILRNRWWYRRLTEGTSDSSIMADWKPRGAIPLERMKKTGIHRVLISP